MGSSCNSGIREQPYDYLALSEVSSEVTDQPLNPYTYHVDFVVWSGLAVRLVYNQLLCVLMVSGTPGFSSKGVLFCLLYRYNHRYFSLILERIPFNRLLACVVSSGYL